MNIVKLLLQNISFECQENSVIPRINITANVHQQKPCFLTYDRNSSGSTPLIEAVRVENFEIVELLLEAKVPVDERNSDKATALHVAAIGKSPEIIELLLAANADINALREGHICPLMYAVMRKCEENVLVLLKHGADASISHNWYGFRKCILYEAAISFASKDVMEALCEAGADLDFKDRFERFPLSAALMAGNIHAIRCLMRYGCSLDTPDKIYRVLVSRRQKRTLLQIAINKKNLDIIRMLYTGGAFTNKILFDCYNDEKLRVRCLDVPQIFETLEYFVSMPQTLMRICRKVVNGVLQKPLPKTVTHICLPTAIKEFLLYSDI